MVNGDSTGMKSWEFFMALVQIYNMFICPFVLVFPEVYQNYNKDEDQWVTETSMHSKLKTFEFIVDIIWMVNIALMFVKRTRGNKNLKSIITSYITGSFLFDIVGTLPCFLTGENYRYYWLKLFRCIVHMFWLTQPLEKIMYHLLRKYSKKR